MKVDSISSIKELSRVRVVRGLNGFQIESIDSGERFYRVFSSEKQALFHVRAESLIISLEETNISNILVKNKA